MKINDRIKLSNGYEMPAFGLGVFRSWGASAGWETRSGALTRRLA